MGKALTPPKVDASGLSHRPSAVKTPVSPIHSPLLNEVMVKDILHLLQRFLSNMADSLKRKLAWRSIANVNIVHSTCDLLLRLAEDTWSLPQLFCFFSCLISDVLQLLPQRGMAVIPQSNRNYTVRLAYSHNPTETALSNVDSSVSNPSLYTQCRCHNRGCATWS